MPDELIRLLGAVNDLTGEGVQATVLLTLVGKPKFSDTVVIEGLAAWDGETPECAPGFLRIGESGLPIGGHGCEGVELIPGGVRWHNDIGQYSIFAASHRDPSLKRRIEQAKADETATFDEAVKGLKEALRDTPKVDWTVFDAWISPSGRR